MSRYRASAWIIYFKKKQMISGNASYVMADAFWNAQPCSMILGIIAQIMFKPLTFAQKQLMAYLFKNEDPFREFQNGCHFQDGHQSE